MSDMRSHPLFQLTLARFRDFMREPEAMFWTFFFPVIMSIALGIAFRNKGPEPVHVAIVSTAQASRASVALGAAKIDARVLPESAALEELRKGRVALLVIATDSGYTYRYDPTQPESRVAKLVVDDALQIGAGRADPVLTRDDHVQEKGSRYIDFVIPGLIGLNLLSTGLWGVGYTVVRMRNDKLLKRLMSTPIRRSHFLLSFIFNRLIFLVAELAIVIGFAWIVFDVPIRGSLLTLVAVAALGACTFTGLGLLIAARTSSVESVQGYMNIVAVPMWILSGVFFSSDNFPAMMQPFIQALPLTALNNAMRAIMLDGSGVADIAGAILNLVVWGAISFILAIRLFRWR